MGILSDVKSTVTRTLASGTGKIGDTVKLIRESGTYNVISGTTTTSDLVFSGTGFSQSISDDYMDLNVSSKSGREIIIYQETLTDAQGNVKEPEVGDEVKVDGIRFDALMVNEGPSSTIWVVVGKD